MPEPTYLDLISASGKPLRHKYFQQGGDPRGLLVLLPGDNYGVDGPLLYYLGQISYERGWDTLALTYGYQSEAAPFSIEVISEMLQECGQSVRAALGERPYARIGLVGKSIGAAIVAVLCETEPLLDHARAAYLTPPLGPLFDQVFKGTSQPAYVALGNKDRFYSKEALDSLQDARTFSLTVVKDADHSLNVPGDLKRTMGIIERVVEETVAFIGNN
jgi:dienelactone hydrolase